MGAIHIARDRVRGESVAIKSAHRLDPLTLSLFKNEFRALADIDHRNLVRLHDLFSRGERWFFTMELIEGAPLVEWLRGRSPAAIAPTLDASGEAAPTTPSPPAGLVGEAEPVIAQPLGPPDPVRLRGALAQLVEAVGALHAHGLVHRDIKPDNIRVEPGGRLVLLDFGLVVRLDGSAGEGGHGGWIAGTPGFMSPQQATGQVPTRADDWYGVGAVLCVALCGLLPDGGGRQALRRWALGLAPGARVDVAATTGAMRAIAVGDPEPDPTDVTDPGAPPEVIELAELADLALGLLEPDPMHRLAPEIVARRLGVRDALPSGPPALVGRVDELDRLLDAAARAAAGERVVCHVHGPSGMGKTALVEGFLSGLAPDAIALRGRSHRREAVPFGPFDALVDDLARHLADWDGAAVDAVLPRNARALARLFPVLDRVRLVREAPGADDLAAADPRATRRRGVRALRDLLARMADRRPVVLFLDDVQHGGPDSAALLDVLCAPPDAPALLIVGCSRGPGGGPLVDALARWAGERVMPLGPLTPPDARLLAGRLLGVSASHRQARRLAAESAGHPFLLAELSVHRDGPRASGGELPSLGGAIRARVAVLPPSARDLLELLALAGRPMAVATLLAATGASEQGRAALASLRASRLVRGGRQADEPVAAVHDMVGEAVAAGLDARRAAAGHRALAEAIEAAEAPDAEALVRHWVEAGERARAAPWATRAGRAAVEATAFEQGVHFFREALALGADDPAVHRALAEALTWAGRPREAARGWHALADRMSGDPRRRALRRAAEQHLIAAESDAGRRILDRLLVAHGVVRPRMPLRLRLGVARQTLRLWFGALIGRSPEPGRTPIPALVEQFDLHLAEVNGLASTTPAEALWSVSRASRAGIGSRSPTRVALGLALGRLLVAMSPLPLSRRAGHRLFEAAERVASGDEAARTILRLVDAVVAARMADVDGLLAALDHIDQRLHGARNERGWEIGLRRVLWCYSLNFTGGYPELRRRVPDMLDDARARGARLEEALLLYYGLVSALLTADRADDLERALDRFAAAAEGDEVGWIAALVQLGRQAVWRYRGEHRAAVDGIRAFIDRHPLARAQRWGDWILEQAGKEAINAGLAVLVADGPDERARALVLDGARIMRRSTSRVSRQWILVAGMGLDRLSGREARALKRLARLKSIARNAPGRVAPILEYIDGCWRGESGRAQVERARATLTAQGVVDPDRWTRLLVAIPLDPCGGDTR